MMNNKEVNNANIEYYWVLLVVSGSDEEESVNRDEEGLSSAFFPLWGIDVAVNTPIILRKNAANILIILRMSNLF